jgi:glycosyltransferase involved in cell wall biosynthesis
MPDLVQQLSGFRAADSVIDGDGTVREPTAEELANPIVAPGTDALLPFGIEYQAPWESPTDGLARHARAQVRALACTGLPVALRRLSRPKLIIDDDAERLGDPTLSKGERDDVLARIAVGKEVGYLRDTSIVRVMVAIRQLVITRADSLEAVVVPAGARFSGADGFDQELAVYRSTIVYTPWERDTVAPEIVEVLNRCAEVWVQGQWCVEVFWRAGVKNVYSMPVPYDPSASLASAIPAPRGSDSVPDGKRFYAIGKWEPRKNYDALIGAFLLEFSPKERASLFLKTHSYGRWEGYPTLEESVSGWLANRDVQAMGWTPERFEQRVRIVTRTMTEEKIAKLHADNNIYVSCSHGEGWDMPAFDARCAGNRLVYTGWSGPAEFAGEDDARVWRGRIPMEPVHPGYVWEANAGWAQCPVPDLRVALRAAEPPKRRVHPPEFCRRYGFGAVGARMARRIEERFPKAFAKLGAAGGFG